MEPKSYLGMEVRKLGIKLCDRELGRIVKLSKKPLNFGIKLLDLDINAKSCICINALSFEVMMVHYGETIYQYDKEWNYSIILR